MYAAELGSTGAAEMSWFQADSSAAEGAFAAPEEAGKTGQLPRLGDGPRGRLPWRGFFLGTATPAASSTRPSAAIRTTFPGERRMPARLCDSGGLGLRLERGRGLGVNGGLLAPLHAPSDLDVLGEHVGADDEDASKQLGADG